MGAIASTYQLTVNKLTGDGAGGFWWVAKDSNGRAYQINFAGENDIVENVAELFPFDTFILLLTGLINNNISLPQVEVNINIDNVSEGQNLQAQFQLTPQQLTAIAANFNVVNLCKLFGVFTLVRLFYQNGNLTLGQLSNVLLYLGETRKIGIAKAEQATGFLLINGDITQAQYDSFWVAWANQVGL